MEDELLEASELCRLTFAVGKLRVPGERVKTFMHPFPLIGMHASGMSAGKASVATFLVFYITSRYHYFHKLSTSVNRIQQGAQENAMRALQFTVSPQMSKFCVIVPITPPITLPESIPIKNSKQLSLRDSSSS